MWKIFPKCFPYLILRGRISWAKVEFCLRLLTHIIILFYKKRVIIVLSSSVKKGDNHTACAFLWKIHHPWCNYARRRKKKTQIWWSLSKSLVGKTEDYVNLQQKNAISKVQKVADYIWHNILVLHWIRDKRQKVEGVPVD